MAHQSISEFEEVAFAIGFVTGLLALLGAEIVIMIGWMIFGALTNG